MVELGRRAYDQLRFREINPKEAFTLVGPDNRYYRASLKSANAHRVEALVYEAMRFSPESPVGIQLVCAFLARQRMIFVSQKATELGVERLLPVFTEHSLGAGALEHEKAHAWPGQAVRASRQCRRASVPEVLAATPLSEALDSDPWHASEECYYLDDQGEPGLVPSRGARRVGLAVGPEGGWTDAERKALRRAGARPLVLGGRVLRAETAVVAGLTLLQYTMGDLFGGAPAPAAATPDDETEYSQVQG